MSVPHERRPRVAIWGAGGHAKVAADVLRAEGRADVVGFIDDSAAAGTSMVIGTSDELPTLVASGAVTELFVGVGDCAVRRRLAERLAALGVPLAPAAVHPRAVVAPTATLDAGALVVAGAVVGPDARVGRCAIVNTGATIDHDCVIGDYAHVGPGAHLGGNVTVGEGAWIGLGASVKHGVTIGAGAVVGLGSAVIRDVEPGSVVYGVPARIAATP